MKYAVISRSSLNVRVCTKKPREGVPFVPLSARSVQALCCAKHSIAWELYYSVLYPARYREARRKGRPNTRFHLVVPDPWLVVVGMLMWEAILQGFAWDSVKVAVRAGLDKLAALNLAPTPKAQLRDSATETQAGFAYTRYATNGKKQYELFVGLRRIAKSRYTLPESAADDRAGVGGVTSG